MDYIHFNLGECNGGETFEITLKGNVANVRLMDATNYIFYIYGINHKFYGGLVKESPSTMQVPGPGHWHIAIDMKGLRGTVNASIRHIQDTETIPQKEPQPTVHATFDKPMLFEGKY